MLADEGQLRIVRNVIDGNQGARFGSRANLRVSIQIDRKVHLLRMVRSHDHARLTVEKDERAPISQETSDASSRTRQDLARAPTRAVLEELVERAAINQHALGRRLGPGRDHLAAVSTRGHLGRSDGEQRSLLRLNAYQP
jgi:hypothetical protein